MRPLRPAITRLIAGRLSFVDPFDPCYVAFAGGAPPV